MSQADSARKRPAVVIVGGGVAGAAAAWLLDGACDVTLLEASARLGGHAQTVSVDFRGSEVPVDLGGQLFGPRSHPRFMRLLEVLGLYDPALPDSGGCITRDMGTTLLDHGGARPRFVSPMFGAGNRRLWPLFAPWNAPGQLAFTALALAGRRFELGGDWAITLEDWLQRVPGLAAGPREHLLLPWLSAMTGCSLDEARALSARAAIAVAVRGLPNRLLAPYSWSTARRGLGSIIDALVAACTTLNVQLDARVVRVDAASAAHTASIHTADGRAFPAEHVIFAAPPYALEPILAASPRGQQLARLMTDFPTFRSRLVIHTDPAYVHPDRRMWSAYNATTFRGQCEGSIWYGAIRDRLPDGSTLDIFKSWASARSREPSDPLFEAEYRHPLQTPAFVAAQARIEALQGQHGLWFAGSWVRDVDLQESALHSAMRVVSGFAPQSANLARLG